MHCYSIASYPHGEKVSPLIYSKSLITYYCTAMHCCEGPSSISSTLFPTGMEGCCCVPETVRSPGGAKPLPTASLCRAGTPTLTSMVVFPDLILLFGSFLNLGSQIEYLPPCRGSPTQGSTFHLSLLTLVWLLQVLSFSLSWPV